MIVESESEEVLLSILDLIYVSVSSGMGIEYRRDRSQYRRAPQASADSDQIKPPQSEAEDQHAVSVGSATDMTSHLICMSRGPCNDDAKYQHLMRDRNF